MSDEASFQQWLGRLRTGDEDAADEVFDRYAMRLVALARSRLSAVILRKIDPEDVMQSTWRSALMRLADGRLEADDWNGLWRLLVCITIHKCSAQATFFRAARRDIHREVELQAKDESDEDWQPIANEPTPHEAGVLVETVEHLLNGFEDLRHREIVLLRLQNYTMEEIGQRVGVSERTVHRILDKVKARLKERAGET